MFSDSTYHDLLRVGNDVLGDIPVVLQDITQFDDHLVEMMQVHLVTSVHRHATHAAHAAAANLSGGGSVGKGGRRSLTRGNIGHGIAIAIAGRARVDARVGNV